MDDRHKLFETLRKIEALYAGAATPGERDAAASARERIRARLKSIGEHERSEEYRFSMDNPWSRKIFVALLRRYGIEPYRYSRQRRTTVMARVPRSFVQQTLMPEFEEMNRALVQHLERITDEILSQEISDDTSEAREVQSLGDGD
jgi:spore cortex formation protein SpoVR/YcgB (stage V sporulation)